MFTLNTAELLANLDQNQVLRIINSARPPSSYLFAKYLPERQMVDFEVKSGNIRIIPTMAGIAGWDSPYPEGGAILASTISGDIAKMAIQVALNERDKRAMYQMLLRMGQGAKSTEYFVNTLLRFSDKILGQAQLDRREWLRGRALIDHEIDWTFNKKDVKANYGIDAKYRPATYSGNNGFGGSTSKFWDAIVAGKKALKHRVADTIAHPDTIEMIMSNEANKARIVTLDEASGNVRLTRIVGTNETNDTDPRYSVSLTAYGLEGSVYDPDNPEAVKDVPFIEPGEIVMIGRGGPRGFNIGADSVGEGATPDEVKPLGYHHIAPTDEGGYALGDWGRIFTPQTEPNKIVGQSVSNNLPVLESDSQLYTIHTDMV